MKNFVIRHNNNIPSEVPQSGSGEGRVYTDITIYHYIVDIQRLFLKDFRLKCINFKLKNSSGGSITISKKGYIKSTLENQ